MARVTLTSRAHATWAEDERPMTDLSQLVLRAGEVVGSFGLDLDWDVLRSRMSSTTRPAPNLRGRCWRGVRARQIVRPGSER